MVKKTKNKKIKIVPKKSKKIIKKKKITKKINRKATVKPAKKQRKEIVSKKAVTIPSTQTAGLEQIGQITHYFPHVNACVIKLSKVLSSGEEIYIKGHTTDFKQKIESMQIDHVSVQSAKAGDEIGILVAQRVRAGDAVYKV